MEFRVLGSFEARHGGVPVGLGLRRQERCLLGILLVEAGHVVPTGRLVELLWNGAAPASARGTVHTYVGRLRAALRPYGVAVESRAEGYSVEPAEHRIDVREFADLVAMAASCGDPGERVRCHDAALELWRGPLLADAADELLRSRLGGRLAELRLSALAQRAEDRLAMGQHARVVADLVPVVDELSSHERLVAALMTALYRDGRRAEALRRYRDTARELAEDAGLSPGPALADLHARVLADDPALDRPPAPLYAVRVAGEWLPWHTSGHPALEFCNTYAGWSKPGRPRGEWLRGYSTLAVWAGYVDLVEDHEVAALVEHGRMRPERADAVLDEARAFRADLYACLTDTEDARAFDAVAAVARDAAQVAVFTRGPDGLGRWRLPPSAGLRVPLYAAARSAAELLADARRFTVCKCPSDDCGWLFLDAGGRRRWCSIATCGEGVSTGGRRGW